MEESLNDNDSFYNFFTPLTNKKIIIFLFIIGVVVFFNMLFNDFVWDDAGQIVTNNYVHSLANIPLFFFGNIHTVYSIGKFFRPLMFTGFTLTYVLFGSTPFFFHIGQLILHCINAYLVYILFCRFLKKNIAFMLSIIFLVHPITVETVSNISHTQDVQFFFFGILALVSIVTYKSKKWLRSYVILSVLLLLSFLSKETGILFWISIILYASLFAKKQVKMIVGAGLVALCIYGGMRYISQAVFDNQITPQILLIIFTSAPKIYYSYVMNFFYPSQLAIYQTWLVTSVQSPNFIYPLIFDSIFTAILSFSAFYLYKKKKELFKAYMFFFIWFIMGIVFHLQLWALEMTYSDRWFYFPMIGLLGMIGILISLIDIRKKNYKIFFISLYCLIVLCLSIRTIVRNADWQNNYTLFAHDAPISQNPLLYTVVLNIFLQNGDYTQAAYALSNLKKIDSNSLLSHLYEARIAVGTGDYAKALALYTYLSHTSDADISYEQITAIQLAHYHNYPEALKTVKEGLTLFPADPNLWRLLAITDESLGDKPGAAQAIQKYNAIVERGQ